VVNKAGAALAVPYAELRDALAGEPWLNVDETGHKDGGKRQRIRDWLKRRKIMPVIPRRVPKDERERAFDRAAYRGRNIVEQCIGWLKECRRVFSRFDKFARSYLAFLQLAILQRLPKIDFSNRP